MEIRFVSDYVCPYCLVAKEALLRALRTAGIDASITWHPFELTEEPKERVDTYHDKVRRSHYQVLVEPCRKLGLDMKLPPNIVPRPYTRLAFEGFFEAKDKGCETVYNDLVYRAYFIDEKDIGDMEVLCGLAEQAGLNAEEFREALLSHKWSAAEKEAVRAAREDLHIRHVPTIFLDGEEVTAEAYTEAAFLDILLHHGGIDGAGAIACGIDGCCGPVGHDAEDHKAS